MNFQKTVLSNGLRLVTIPMKDTATVTVLVLVEAGSKYETKDISGLSHFLEHMCFKGTQKRPTAHILSTELDSIGAESNAFTSHEYTGYYAKAHSRHFNNILDIVSDLYQNPRFDTDEINREKGVIIEEINMYEDMPQRNVQDVLMAALYDDQPAAWSIAGTKETVSAMTKSHFESYIKDHYVAQATTVVIAGSFDEKTVVADVEKMFASVRQGTKKDKKPINDIQSKPRVVLKEKQSDQTHMVLALRTYPITDERNYALGVLAGVLGRGMSSRLFQILREQMGVCYYVHAGIDAYTDHGTLQIATGVDTKRTEEVVSVLITELRRLTNECVPEQELTKVKEYITGKLFLGLESSDSCAEYIGSQEVLRRPLITPQEYSKKIQGITAEDVQRIAKDIVKSATCTLALVGPKRDTSSLEKIISF